MTATLTPKQFRERLGLSASQFRRHEKAGRFQRLTLAQPVGRQRYSTAAVERFMAGQSPVIYGAGKFMARRSA